METEHNTTDQDNLVFSVFQRKLKWQQKTPVPPHPPSLFSCWAEGSETGWWGGGGISSLMTAQSFFYKTAAPYILSPTPPSLSNYHTTPFKSEKIKAVCSFCSGPALPDLIQLIKVLTISWLVPSPVATLTFPLILPPGATCFSQCCVVVMV